MDAKFKICTSCLQDEENVPSSEWCWDCMEGLCDGCSKYHRKQKPSRCHKLSVINKTSLIESLIHYANPSCYIHTDNEVSSYCIKHQTLCCQTCKCSENKDCDQSLVSLDEAISKNALPKHDIAMIVKNVEQSLDLITENLRQSLASLGEDVIQVSATIRQDIDKYFDELEGNLKKDLLKKRESYLETINQENCTLQKSSKDIEIIKTTVCNLPEEMPANSSFIIRSRVMQKLQQYNGNFKTSSHQIKRLVFTPADIMTILKNSITSFGDIAIANTEMLKSDKNDTQVDTKQVRSSEMLLNITDKKDQSTSFKKYVPVTLTDTKVTQIDNIAETKSYISNCPDGKDSVVVDLKEITGKSPTSSKSYVHSTEKTPAVSPCPKYSTESICNKESNRTLNTASLTDKLQLSVFGSNAVATECCYLPDGKVVFVDNTNKCLMSCNDRGRQQKRQQVSQEPFDITVYDKTRLIVALGNDGMQVLNIPSLRPIGKNIHLGGRCTAITHEKEHIIVAVDDRLRLVTIEGKLIRHIDHPGLVWSLSAVHHGKIYYSDFTDDDDVLHCITLAGKNVFSYKNDKLIGPTGVAVDNNGNIYVAGLSSHNVHQLTSDGKLKTIILTKEDGIKYPRGMAYNKDKRELLLINQDRKTVQFYCIS